MWVDTTMQKTINSVLAFTTTCIEVDIIMITHMNSLSKRAREREHNGELMGQKMPPNNLPRMWTRVTSKPNAPSPTWGSF